MTSGQKIAFSLLAAFALFAVFAMSLHSALFKTLETRFYAQSKIEENTGQLNQISESCDSNISEILSLIEKGENAWTKNASVRSYYVQNPSESDVNTRRRLTENLFAQIPSLTGIRIVDKNGRNVHYSSFDDTDLLKQNGITKFYKNYNDIAKDADEIPFETIQKLSDETKSVLLFDEGRSRVILSVPFSWVDGIYSGTCLFYLNVHELFGLGFTLFSDDDFNGGLVLNLPYGNKNEFKTPVLNYWKKAGSAVSDQTAISNSPEKLLELPDGRYYVALSSNRAGKVKISSVYTSDVFELSKEVRILIYVCVFISILLIVFLVLSLFRDPMIALQKRIKKVQLEIIQNYIDDKEKREWGDVARQLRLRRDDLSKDIIKSLHVHSKKQKKELSEYLDKNWDEIFAIFEAKTGVSSSVNANTNSQPQTVKAAEVSEVSMAEIRRMFEEVLKEHAGGITVAAPAPLRTSAVPVTAASAGDEVEELAEELDEVEELAEDVDEVEELDDAVEELAEDVDEVEELAEDVDEVEELDDAVEELAEDIDEVEELDDAVEELDEEVEELDDAVEELDDAVVEPVETTDDEVEELAEEVDAVEELDDAVEELDEEVEELDEEVEDLDDAVEELDEDLDVLEEYVEPQPSQNSKDFDAFLSTLAQPKKEYDPNSLDTYFASEKFPHVENLFAEELYIGHKDLVINTTPIPIKVYALPEYKYENEAKADEVRPVEEPDKIDWPEEEHIEEPEVLEESSFSMASFADNISEEIPELDGALAVPVAPEDTIIEKDGVFTISENIEYTNIVQDPEFKELVDSIL